MSRQLSEMLSNSTATQGEVESEKRSRARHSQTNKCWVLCHQWTQHGGWEGLVLGAVILTAPLILMDVSFRSFSEVYHNSCGGEYEIRSLL